jgi:hypothetical protein
MIANHTGLLKVPLVSGTAGDNPSLTQGSETTFGLSNLPAEKDGLASYLLGIVCYLSGNVVQSGGTGSLVAWEDVVRALIASFSVRNAWHGTPVNSAWVLGSDFPLWSYVFNGYRYLQRVPRSVPAANGTYPFNIRLFLPLHCGVGRKPHHTAQLALLYRDAIFGMNVAASSVLTGLSTGSSITSLTARCTALCLLEPEVRMGPAFEIVDYTSPTPAATSFDTRFQDFANNTAIAGTERGAGIVWSMLRSSVRGGGGPVDFSTLTRVAVPFRGQSEISDVGSFLDEAIDAMGPTRVIGSTLDSATAQVVDNTGYPNIVGALDPLTINAPVRASTLLGFPIVSPGLRARAVEGPAGRRDDRAVADLLGGALGRHPPLAHRAAARVDPGEAGELARAGDPVEPREEGPRRRELVRQLRLADEADEQAGRAHRRPEEDALPAPAARERRGSAVEAGPP